MEIILLGLGVLALVVIVYLLRVILSTHKIVDIYDKIEKIENEMICPLCFGKGFIDNHDIVRFNKVNDWKMGFCKFCDTKGREIKGIAITKTMNPMEIME